MGKYLFLWRLLCINNTLFIPYNSQDLLVSTINLDISIKKDTLKFSNIEENFKFITWETDIIKNIYNYIYLNMLVTPTSLNSLNVTKLKVFIPLESYHIKEELKKNRGEFINPKLEYRANSLNEEEDNLAIIIGDDK